VVNDSTTKRSVVAPVARTGRERWPPKWHVERVRSLCSNRMVYVAVERRLVQARRREDALGLRPRVSVPSRLRTRRRGRPSRRSRRRWLPCGSISPSQEPAPCCWSRGGHDRFERPSDEWSGVTRALV